VTPALRRRGHGVIIAIALQARVVAQSARRTEDVTRVRFT
jgi:hypothetical protein